MTTALIGYTGFVGGNLCLSHPFDCLYNSKNIETAFGTCPDLLVYAGVRSEMYLANKYPDADKKIIDNAIENIKKIKPRRVVLVSTIGVYASMNDGDENTVIDRGTILPYGRNRLALEEWVAQNCPSSLIVRLPALFGKGIKKNFIFDMIHIVPSLLKEEKYQELLSGTNFAGDYQSQDNGFYKCVVTDADRLKELKNFFQEKGFSALSFTDSRSCYQFFNLANLWDLIQRALHLDIPLLTIASEPIGVSELYEYIYRLPFVNEIHSNYPRQNLHSIYADVFGGSGGYLYGKEELMKEIKDFVTKNAV